MKTRVKWIEDLTFSGESNSGHSLVMSAGEKFGGRDSGFRPMELLLMGTGGCTAIDVLSILKKARQEVVDCEVSLSAERSGETPAVFTAIHIHFRILGRKINEKQVQRAIALSAEKYCSASIMLAKTASITHSYEIEECPQAE
jgi:putative redox protein